jgi:acetylornithine deacetylase
LTAVQRKQRDRDRQLPEGTVSLPVDPDLLLRDAAAILRIPSVTGQERPVLEALAELAAGYGLEADLRRYDLTALRAHPGHPGEEVPRDELWGLEVTLPGGPRRVCVNGHVDVVGPGTLPWRHGPWAGAREDGRLYGRGAVDMKGPVVAALHALAALRGTDTPTVVLQCVASEEDGGLGTFAALERDAAYDAALIPEPTSFDVVCAQAGALTFRCVIPGRAAHAAHRLEGCSAIDRYVRVHQALQALEREVNASV